MENTEIFLFSEYPTEQVCKSGVRLNKFISERANAFVRTKLSERLGISYDALEILRSKKGKPYIPGGRLQFNISHSGHTVAAAISEQEVGVDVENVREYSDKVARRFFTQNELEYLDGGWDEPEKQMRFFEIWTAKEAFLKYLGVGLSGGFDFDTADVRGMKREVFSQKLGNAEIITFRKCCNSEECVLSLCLKSLNNQIVTINETSSTL